MSSSFGIKNSDLKSVSFAPGLAMYFEQCYLPEEGKPWSVF